MTLIFTFDFFFRGNRQKIKHQFRADQDDKTKINNNHNKKKSGQDVMAYFILYFHNFISNWNFEFLVRITKYLAITSSENKIRSFEFRAILRNGV